MTVLLKNVMWLQNTSLWITLNRTLSTSAATDILNGLSIKVVWMLEPIPAVIEWKAGVQKERLSSYYRSILVIFFNICMDFKMTLKYINPK